MSPTISHTSLQTPHTTITIPHYSKEKGNIYYSMDRNFIPNYSGLDHTPPSNLCIHDEWEASDLYVFKSQFVVRYVPDILTAQVENQQTDLRLNYNGSIIRYTNTTVLEITHLSLRVQFCYLNVVVCLTVNALIYVYISTVCTADIIRAKLFFPLWDERKACLCCSTLDAVCLWMFTSAVYVTSN